MKAELRSMLIVQALAVVVLAISVNGQETLSRAYQFGPGLAQTNAAEVNLRVPARTNVVIAVELQRAFANAQGVPVPADVPIVIEIIKPDGVMATTRNASATVVSGALQVPAFSFPGLFSDRTGCPNAWKVRIRTNNNGTPPVRIFGSVNFAFARPGAVDLDIIGSNNVSGGNDRTLQLTGKNPVGLSDPSLIAGTGTMRIRAKWHTDPIDLLNFGKFFRLTVALLRPNGSVAASETGFSQHAPADKTPKVNFTYTVTAQDAAQTGQWRIRISSASGNPKIVDFDVERGFDINSPSFNSKFEPSCSPGVAVF